MPSLKAFLAYASEVISKLPLLLSDNNPQPHSIFDSTKPAQQQQPIVELGLERPPQTVPGVTLYDPLSGAPSCPVDGPISCNNKTAGDSCCFVHPGGRMLLTQFWDEEIHVGGAETDWTLHGLWPDLCDGSYDQYCGMTPTFNNISTVLKHYDQGELIEFMNRYWVANYGTNEHLWAHEYNKHATCINTLAPACYGSESYEPGMEVVDYFVRAFGLFRTLDTYRALQRAGIEPHQHDTFALEDVQSALEEFSGGKVVLKCGRGGTLHEAWYVYFVQGSLQSGVFVPARDSFHGDSGNCPPRVRYLPKRARR
ncbi:ribonuclease Trv [Xylariaceae sp. FL0255]|nr:ribonuclease Trv [Xylariaceae sp. FL0255]